MSKLTKDSIFVAERPPVPATPGSPPHPAYCTKTPHTVPLYIWVPTEVWRIEEDGTVTVLTKYDQVQNGTTTEYVETCYPASEGTPGTPGSAGSPAHTDLQVGWNSGAVSIPSLPGNAQYTFSIRPDAVGVVSGFNSSNEGVSYFEIDHGMYLRSGMGTIIEAGKEIAGTSFSYSQSDVLAVVRIGSGVRYYKGTTLLYTSLVPSYGTVYADCSLYMGGDQILDAALTSVVDGPKYGASSGGGDGTLPALFMVAADMSGTPAAPPTASPVWSIHNSGTAGTYTLPAWAVVQGNLLVVLACGADNHTSISDTMGNTWVALGETNEGASYYNRMFYSLSCKATGNTTVTLVSTASDGGRMSIGVQFTGNYAFDNVDVGVSNGSNSFTSPSYSTTAAGLVICSMLAQSNSPWLTVTGGAAPPFTTLVRDFRASLCLDVLYKFTSGAVVGQSHSVGTNSGNKLIRIAAFKTLGTPVDYQGQGRNLGPIRITSFAQQQIVGQGDAYIKVGSTANALKPGQGVGLGYIQRMTTYAESGLLAPDFAVLDQPFAPISGWARGESGDVGRQQNSYIKVTGSGWDALGGGASAGIMVRSLAYTNDAVLGGMITADIRLKPLEMDVDFGDLQGGMLSGAAIQLQRLTAKGYTGAHASAVLKPLTVAWVLTQWNTIKGDVVLEEMYGTSYLIRGGKIDGRVKLARLLGASGGTEGPGHIAGASAPGFGTLQALTTQGHITANETIRAALLLNQLGASSSLSLYGFPITGNLVLAPLYSSSGSKGVATLPGLVARGILLDPTSVFEGWATNLRTGGTTRLANLPFLQMLQVPGGPLLGIANDGNVYELTGDKDIGQPIMWEFETGLSDLGQAGMKRVPYVYVDGIVQGSIDITVLTDDPAKTYVYEYVAVDRAQHKPHKRKLGNAIRTRSVAFRLSSVTGTYVEIDSIEPEIDVTQRSV